MEFDNQPTRDQARGFSAEERSAHQLRRLNELLAAILPGNRFYSEKLADCETNLPTLEALADLPLTTKSELVDAVAIDASVNLTYPANHYVRVHRTSGTSGAPLYVYDTAKDWMWWKEAWQFVLDAAKVQAGDRALMAFSFGPFVGFWSANDALIHRHAMVIPTGGLSTSARLQMMCECDATIVCCTPTYALRMAEVAAAEGFDLKRSRVDRLIVAGEPGGSLPEVRNRIESAWGARVVDHAGASELGPWGYGDQHGTGMFVNEADFIAELLPHANDDDLFELVLTGLGRIGWPLLRYRTGDLVRKGPSPDSKDTHLFLPGGILGRADDMVVIRGVNIFPSSVENVIRSIESVGEFRITATRDGALDQLKVEVEAETESAVGAVAAELNKQLGLRVDVERVADGSLPRFEAKSRRFLDQRA